MVNAFCTKVSSFAALCLRVVDLRSGTAKEPGFKGSTRKETSSSNVFVSCGWHTHQEVLILSPVLGQVGHLKVGRFQVEGDGIRAIGVVSQVCEVK